jgi:RND family efflux transporter MFP subunit
MKISNLRLQIADWKRAAGGFAVAALLLAAAAGCGRESAKQAVATETAREVRAEAVMLERVADEIEAPGTVASANSAEISARVMGAVTHVAVREGDAVRAGQLLIALDERELAARRSAAASAVEEARAAREEVARAVIAAEAQAEVARRTYDRFDFLRAQKSVSAQEFDEVAARQKAAQAQLDAARAKQQQVEAMLARAQSEALAANTVAGYARLTAPFSGVVVRRQAEPGQLAAPGIPLLALEDTSRYRLEVTVDAGAMFHVKRGSKARVQIDALPGKNLEGTVVEMEAGADAASHTARVRLELPRDAAIRSGLFGRAWFRRGERHAIALPEGAILHRGQLYGVYVVAADGTAQLRLVTLGPVLADGRVEILSGLSHGERVVLDPAGRELDEKKIAP